MKKSRESFEYRIAQQSKTVKDYLEYIKYERGLVTLIRERNKLYKTDMDQSLIKLISVRMKQIYSEALTKFPHDIRFWDEYIKFMQQFKFLSDISPTFDRMLQVSNCTLDINFVRMMLIIFFTHARSFTVRNQWFG